LQALRAALLLLLLLPACPTGSGPPLHCSQAHISSSQAASASCPTLPLTSASVGSGAGQLLLLPRLLLLPPLPLLLLLPAVLLLSDARLRCSPRPASSPGITGSTSML
jgi:hypothetical protein